MIMAISLYGESYPTALQWGTLSLYRNSLIPALHLCQRRMTVIVADNPTTSDTCRYLAATARTQSRRLRNIEPSRCEERKIGEELQAPFKKGIATDSPMLYNEIVSSVCLYFLWRNAYDCFLKSRRHPRNRVAYVGGCKVSGTARNTEGCQDCV